MEDIEDVKSYLVECAEYDESEVKRMSRKEVFEAWLTAHDIYNLTDDIIEVVNAIYEVGL